MLSNHSQTRDCLDTFALNSSPPAMQAVILKCHYCALPLFRHHLCCMTFYCMGLGGAYPFC